MKGFLFRNDVLELKATKLKSANQKFDKRRERESILNVELRIKILDFRKKNMNETLRKLGLAAGLVASSIGHEASKPKDLMSDKSFGGELNWTGNKKIDQHQLERVYNVTQDEIADLEKQLSDPSVTGAVREKLEDNLEVKKRFLKVYELTGNSQGIWKKNVTIDGKLETLKNSEGIE